MALDATKKKLLKDFCDAQVAGEDVNYEEYDAEGNVTKKSKANEMMETLQGELTETELDAAMFKALADYGATHTVRGASLLTGDR